MASYSQADRSQRKMLESKNIVEYLFGELTERLSPMMLKPICVEDGYQRDM
jgi:hypothetical protein